MDTEILNITTIDEYNKTFGFETLHPQVSVVDFSKNGTVKPHRMNIGFYALFLKEGLCGDLLYRRGSYDYQEGTIVSYAPGHASANELKYRFPYLPCTYYYHSKNKRYNREKQPHQ